MFNTAPTSRVQALVADIEQSIVERRLSPGDRICTMDDLRTETGLARQTISEAARLLADRGTVEIRPGRGGGLFVAAATPVVRLRHTLLSVPEGGATVADAIAVRDALEELVCTDAARSRSRADIRDLRQAVARLRRSATSSDRFMAANWDLHERIAQITPNGLARSIYLSTLRCMSELATDARPDGAEDQEEYHRHRVEIHVRLVDAIAAGDVELTARSVLEHRGLTAGAERPPTNAGPDGSRARSPR